MRPVIEASARIDDSYLDVVSDDIPERGDVIVPLARWLSERESLLHREGRIGVALTPSDDPEVLAKDIAALDLIAVHFPQFTDGRAYSQARVLRDQLGFAGRIRARGEVLPDQLEFMRRCGIDSFELADEPAAERALSRSRRFSVAYQPAVTGPVPAYRHRA